MKRKRERGLRLHARQRLLKLQTRRFVSKLLRQVVQVKNMFAWIFEKQRQRRIIYIAIIFVILSPLLLDFLLPRETAFRIYGSTEAVSLRLDPQASGSLTSIELLGADVCLTPSMASISTDGVCGGFDTHLRAVSGVLEFQRPMLLNIEQADDAGAVLILSETANSTAQGADSPQTPCESGFAIFYQEEEREPFDAFEDGFGPSQTQICELAIVHLNMDERNNDSWLVARGSNLRLGKDLNSRVPRTTSAMREGGVEIHGKSLASELSKIVRPNRPEQSGFLLLSEEPLRLGDSVRAIDKLGEGAKVHLVLNMTANEAFTFNVWTIADRTLVSGFGSPDRRIQADWLMRLSRDPLLKYWTMLLIVLVFSFFRIRMTF